MSFTRKKKLWNAHTIFKCIKRNNCIDTRLSSIERKSQDKLDFLKTIHERGRKSITNDDGSPPHVWNLMTFSLAHILLLLLLLLLAASSFFVVLEMHIIIEHSKDKLIHMNVFGFFFFSFALHIFSDLSIAMRITESVYKKNKCSIVLLISFSHAQSIFTLFFIIINII